MEPQTCVDRLFNEQSLEARKHVLLTYLEEWVQNMPAGCMTKHSLHRWAIKELLGSVPVERASELCRLIVDLQAHEKRVRQTKTRRLASALRDLEPGTQVLIDNNGKEEVLTFLSMRRTRFLARRKDGAAVTVPVEMFTAIVATHASDNMSSGDKEEAKPCVSIN